MKKKHFYLLRGLIRESGHWGKFPELIKKEFPDAEITYLDIPGAGPHFEMDSPIHVEEMVQFMRKTYFKNNPNEERILVAISLGGMNACEWLRSFPEDFQKAVMINTSFGDLSPFYRRMLISGFAHIFQVPFKKGREKEYHIIKIVSNNKDQHQEMLDLWHEIASKRPVSVKNSIRQLFAGLKFSTKGYKPHIPVLILVGEKDRLVSPQCSNDIAREWGVKLSAHPEAGHDLAADAGEWIVQEIKNFVS